jgi:hypothetical protein
VAGTAEAACRAAGSFLASGQGDAARVERAALVIGHALTYDYCLTGCAWSARLECGRTVWAPAPPLPGRAAS